jgi:hypothetical protein
MSEKEGRMYGIVGRARGWYIRLDEAKANLSPPGTGRAAEVFGGSGDGGVWFKKVSVPLVAVGGGAEYEPTGTLEPVVLDAVSSAVTISEQLSVVKDVVIGKLKDGESYSVYQLGEAIASLGVLDLSSRQIMRLIEEVFKEVVTGPNGLRYIAVQKKYPSGKSRSFVCCNTVNPGEVE